ncbi:hypothetical protein BCR43DRAFT_481113 [Syncephalastrum racemosum]|uniref:Uncharacterized protein n=1 Tax=Syncephalastrum racemosum TaxID=13706 RepID=A0A1X2HRG5_SYNRA|nr:hypothetical protein BCR43DRAFT_481113 [Syncephalastrum racemosum]
MSAISFFNGKARNAFGKDEGRLAVPWNVGFLCVAGAIDFSLNIIFRDMITVTPTRIEQESKDERAKDEIGNKMASVTRAVRARGAVGVTAGRTLLGNRHSGGRQQGLLLWAGGRLGMAAHGRILRMHAI